MRGLPAAELARRADISKGVVYKAFRGDQALSIDQILALAHGLEVPVTDLLPVDAPSTAGRPLSPAQLALLDAIEARDPSAIRLALAELLPERTLAEVREPPLTADQERFFAVMERTGNELLRLARSASKAAEAGPAADPPESD